MVPDIELVPVPAPRPGCVRLSEVEPQREANLERAFGAKVPAVRPEFSMRYVAATPNREEEVGIARDLLLELPATSGTRKAALDHAGSFVDERRAANDERIVRVLGEAGVDWSPGAAGRPARVVVRCRQQKDLVPPPVRDGADSNGDGGRVPIDCEVRNEGEGDAFRVSGRAPSLSLDLAGEEIVIGRVAAGESRRVSLEGILDANPAARVTYVPFSFSEQDGAPVESAPVRIEMPARPVSRPASASPPKGPEIRIAASSETSGTSGALRAEIRSSGEVRDAWVRVSHRERKIDRKKVVYASRDAGRPVHEMDLSADVPLLPGSNEIEVCARDKDGQRCETAFVFRKETGSL